MPAWALVFDPHFYQQEVTDEEDDSDWVCRGDCADGFGNGSAGGG
jgi:hypothetical protein